MEYYFAKIPIWLFSYPMKSNAKIIYCYILNRSNIARSSSIKISISKIARENGIAPNTARQSLKELEKIGLISIERVGDNKAPIITIKDSFPGDENPRDVQLSTSKKSTSKKSTSKKLNSSSSKIEQVYSSEIEESALQNLNNSAIQILNSPILNKKEYKKEYRKEDKRSSERTRARTREHGYDTDLFLSSKIGHSKRGQQS